MVLIALAVRAEDRGPSLFRQERVGLGRSRFTMLKFRTMSAGGDDRALRDLIARELRGEDTAVDGSSKLSDDRRVTRIGAFLRRTSLDELPQLINVLRGDMTLVGPRPCLEWEAEMFPRRVRAAVRRPPRAHRSLAGQRAEHARHAGHAAARCRMYVAQPLAALGPGHAPARTVRTARDDCAATGRDDDGVRRDHRRPSHPARRPRRADPARRRVGVGDPRERAEHIAARATATWSTSRTSACVTSAACCAACAAARSLYRRRRPTRAVSTGSGIALGYLPYLAARGVECHYIESAARVSGPSLTGRILRRVPRVRTYTQYRTGAGRTGTTAAAVSTPTKPVPGDEPLGDKSRSWSPSAQPWSSRSAA